MAKKKETDAKDIEVSKPKVVKPKKATKFYALKKATVIGDELKPVGYKIPLTVKGYKFLKQKNIV